MLSERLRAADARSALSDASDRVSDRWSVELGLIFGTLKTKEPHFDAALFSASARDVSSQRRRKHCDYHLTAYHSPNSHCS